MVLEGLGRSLRGTLKKIANAHLIDKDLVKEVVRDIQRALLQADVNVKLALTLTKGLEERALSEKPPSGMSNREHVIRIIYEELVKILGGARELEVKKQRIMLVGLYGQGKTTTSAKLAKHFQKRGMKVALIAADVHRPAAYDQLSQLAEQVNVPVYGRPDEKKAAKIVREGVKQFDGYDVILCDTSGRHSLEDDLIEEVKRIKQVLDPDEVLLVLDAAVGQQAGPQAKAFHDAAGVTGVIITKLDGTAKAGGALSAVSETEAPIVFIGTGEHIDDLETFDPPRFISRMLGMGDLQTLLEKAQEVMSEEQAEETARKILSGRFTLKEMYEQMAALANMGPLSKIMQMIPGMPGKLSEEDMDKTQARLKNFRIIMDSMTEEEMENPKMIKSSRVQRIAKGAGVEPRAVRELLKQYNMSKKAVKGMVGNRKIRRQLMKQMKAGNLPGL